MAYVLAAAKPANLLSNINYIGLFASLNDSSEIWFMNLKSSLEILKKVIGDKQKLPTSAKVSSLITKYERNRKKTIRLKAEQLRGLLWELEDEDSKSPQTMRKSHLRKSSEEMMSSLPSSPYRMATSVSLEGINKQQ
jgi:hypothetical protein